MIWSCCEAQYGFELEILLPQPPKYWNYRLGHYAELTCPPGQMFLVHGVLS